MDSFGAIEINNNFLSIPQNPFDLVEYEDVKEFFQEKYTRK